MFGSVVYSSILHSERSGLHERILSVLEKQENKDPSLLAHHYQAVGSVSALDYYSEAAEAAWEV